MAVEWFDTASPTPALVVALRVEFLDESTAFTCRPVAMLPWMSAAPGRSGIQSAPPQGNADTP